VLLALTRDVSARLGECELTHLARVPIDVERARAQHDAYEALLGRLGCRVERLAAGPDMPDSVFIEDIAIVFDELAIVTRPGAESRRVETAAVADALRRFRTLRFIEAPGTVDGGDVLVAGRRVFVGRSSRTNAAAVAQMRAILAPHGYSVCEVAVEGCLHLKSAVTAIGDDVLLANRAWIDPRAFADCEIVDVDRDEPSAANAVRVGGALVFPSAFPKTASRLAARGFTVHTVDASELAKAEGAVTCCSLIVDL